MKILNFEALRSQEAERLFGRVNCYFSLKFKNALWRMLMIPNSSSLGSCLENSVGKSLSEDYGRRMRQW